MSHADIRIGTLASGGAKLPNYLRQIIPHGFESFEITFWQYLGDTNLKKLAAEVKAVLADAAELPDVGGRPIISALGLFGNPLEDKKTAKDWARIIDAAPLFGVDLVCGFSGCLAGKPVPEAMKVFKKTWKPLVDRAADKGLRIAFENCDMGGRWDAAQWNIAHSPTAWEMIFNEIPADNLGLEWEPCHQMVSLVDPIPQLRKWVKKVFHVHGKDATVNWDVLRQSGLRGGKPWVFHRTPGFGDSNWTDIITILRQGGFKGAIDIEGWHDPVYRGQLEMTGQVRGLNYLKACRGGAFIPNPA